MNRAEVVAEYRELMARNDLAGALVVLQKDAERLGLYPNPDRLRVTGSPLSDAAIDEVIAGVVGSDCLPRRTRPPSPSPRPEAGGH
jgi:hypothetical protein